jgi:hypothetical protein
LVAESHELRKIGLTISGFSWLPTNANVCHFSAQVSTAIRYYSNTTTLMKPDYM